MALAIVVASSAALVPAGLAIAQEASERAACPDPPAEYSGEDAVVREVRLARTDARVSCLAARDDADAAIAAAEQAHADAQTAHADAERIATALEAGQPDAESDEPETVALAKPDGDRLDAMIVALGALLGFAGVALTIPALRAYWHLRT